jgi:hypothetical protein
VGVPLVLRGRVSALGCASGSAVSPGSFVGVVLFCFQCRTAHAAMHGWVHSLSVASGASRKSLTKVFKEQGKTIKDLVQGMRPLHGQFSN